MLGCAVGINPCPTGGLPRHLLLLFCGVRANPCAELHSNVHVCASAHLAFLVVSIGRKSQEVIPRFNQTTCHKDIFGVGVGFHPPRRMGLGGADTAECGFGKTSCS